MNQKTLIAAGIGAAVIAGGAWLFFAPPDTYSNIASYEDCVAAGYPVLETYPEQCKLPDGRTFTHAIDDSGSVATTTAQTAVLGKPVTLRTGGKAVFPGELSLTLKEINDSRCPQDVQCVWQGELSALFSVTLGGVSEELRLGTVMKQSAVLKGYTFTLQNATPESATAVVAFAPVPAGGISGFIHTGPTCPVERMPPDPNCADRPYANAKVVIRNKANGAVASQSASDLKGNFRAALAPGAYAIEVSSPTGSPLPFCETKEAEVKTGAFTSVDVSCDSGIR